MLQPNFGGRIIDIVSRNIQTPDERTQALDDVKNTILAIFTIVAIGYIISKSGFYIIYSRYSEIIALHPENITVFLRSWLV